MIQELLYTSHEGKGLRHSAGGGYCTVLSTEGMATNLAIALEKLSGYKHPFDIHDQRAPHSPTIYRHTVIRVGGITYHVLSRIANLRREHTGRSNKLAHHLALTTRDLPIGGPSWIMMKGDVCRKDWDGRVRLVKATDTVTLPHDDIPAKPCTAWKESAGDAGWAGHVADQLNLDDATRVSIIYPLHTNTLALVNEALSLLAHERRWQVTFSTYFTALPAGTSCQLRFYLDGTTEAEKLRHDNRERILDLTSRLGAAPESELADTARTRSPTRSTVTTVAERPATQPSHTDPTALPGARSEADAASQPNDRVTVASSDSGDEYHLMPPILRPDLRSRQQHDLAGTSHRRPWRKRTKLIIAASLVTALLGMTTGIGVSLIGLTLFDARTVSTTTKTSDMSERVQGPRLDEHSADGEQTIISSQLTGPDVTAHRLIDTGPAGTGQTGQSRAGASMPKEGTDPNTYNSMSSTTSEFPTVLELPSLPGDPGSVGETRDSIRKVFRIEYAPAFSLKQLIGTTDLVESEAAGSIGTQDRGMGETRVVLKLTNVSDKPFAKFSCASDEISFEWIPTDMEDESYRKLFRGIRWCVAQFTVEGNARYVLLSRPEPKTDWRSHPRFSPGSTIALNDIIDSTIPLAAEISGRFQANGEHEHLRIDIKDNFCLSVKRKASKRDTRNKQQDDDVLRDEVLRINIITDAKTHNKELYCQATLIVPCVDDGITEKKKNPKKGKVGVRNIQLSHFEDLDKYIRSTMKHFTPTLQDKFGENEIVSSLELYEKMKEHWESEQPAIYRFALAIEAVKWLQDNPPSWKGKLEVDYDAEGDVPSVTILELDVPIEFTALPEVKTNDPANGTPERNP